MKRILITSIALVALTILVAAQVQAQSMDDLNLQVHGYATQGFIYSTNNNWNTTDSTDGSAAWTEAVVNLTTQPQSRLRIGVQARYFLLGNHGNQITLDWAQADYKVNEKFGFRAGKVKTPAGLFNDTQDIDPAHLWILLPQSIYPIASRGSVLAHFGGVAYGTIPLGEFFGKLEYRAYGGARVVDSDDGYLQALLDEGLTFPNGLTARVLGATLRWDTPLPGLMVGASQDPETFTGTVVAGPYDGTFSVTHFDRSYFFGQYQHRKAMLAAEYSRLPAQVAIVFPGPPMPSEATDRRAFYVMGSYKLADKLTAGAYYSSCIDKTVVQSSIRYQKDWTVSGRYDFSSFLYLKAEQHFVDGTEIGYSTSDNPGGLKPDSRMTLLKLGVSF